MNMRSLMTILFGTALAGGASYAVMNFSDTGAGAAEAVEVPMQEVVVALSEINYGDVIDPRLLGTQSWPRDSVPQGVFLNRDSFSIDGQPRRALSYFPYSLLNDGDYTASVGGMAPGVTNLPAKNDRYRTTQGVLSEAEYNRRSREFVPKACLAPYRFLCGD